jgi:hypothetical protein
LRAKLNFVGTVHNKKQPESSLSRGRRVLLTRIFGSSQMVAVGAHSAVRVGLALLLVLAILFLLHNVVVSSGLLCWPPTTGPKLDRHDPASLPSNDSPGPAYTNTQVLVLVLAGGTKLQYEFYRVYWKLMAAQARRFGVQVYLLSFGQELRIARDSLTFVGQDSLVPGCLKLTTLALRTIIQRGLPGSDFAALVRTNLSTFWDFRRLLLAPELQRIGFFSPSPLYGVSVATLWRPATVWAVGMALAP